MSVVQVEQLRRQVSELRAQVDERDEIIRQLREALTPPTPIPGWVPRLSPTELVMFRTMMARDVVTQSMFDAALPLSAIDPPDPRERMRVYICRLRKVLAPFGVKIVTVWGQGYRLDRASVAEAEARHARFSQATHPSTSVSGGTAQPTARPMAEVASGEGNRSHA